MKGVIAVASAFALACGAAAYAYLDRGDAAPAPAITTPAPQVLGLSVGRSTVDEVSAAVKRHGLACKDASLMAMMAKAHAANGVDGVSSASKKKKKPSDHQAMLASPLASQVRTSCEEVPSTLIAGAPGVTGRLLIVHPDAKKPIELVTYQRHHRDHAVATADLEATLRALEATYGQPTTSRGDRSMALLEQVELEWRFADIVLRVKALWFGDRGGSVSEEIRLASATPAAS